MEAGEGERRVECERDGLDCQGTMPQKEVTKSVVSNVSSSVECMSVLGVWRSLTTRPNDVLR